MLQHLVPPDCFLHSGWKSQAKAQIHGGHRRVTFWPITGLSAALSSHGGKQRGNRLSSSFLFIMFYIYLCVCVGCVLYVSYVGRGGGSACHGRDVGVRRQRVGFLSLLRHVSVGDGTRAVRLDSKHLYPANPLLGPNASS